MTETVGGTTLGYCATGRLNSATPPMTIIRMASTFARTGRSMKNFEIMTRPLLAVAAGSAAADCGHLQLRIDLLPGDRVEDALHDDAILRLEPAVDDAHLPTVWPGCTRRWSTTLSALTTST